jgi:hypothetical protein
VPAPLLRRIRSPRAGVDEGQWRPGQNRRVDDEGARRRSISTRRARFCRFWRRRRQVPSLFPENSRPAATPRPIQNLGKHGRRQIRFAKFGADAKDALAKVTDLDSFKAAFGAIGKNDCGGCHEKYRIKKS